MYTKHNLSDFSSYSVICAVDKFVKSVDSMNDTVMVPSRLLDLAPESKEDRVPALLRGSTDSYTFFNHLNTLKHELIWGVSEEDEECEERDQHNPTWFVQSSNGRITEDIPESSPKGHTRKVSSVSTVSVSSGVSEHENERLSDAGDSGLGTEDAETAVNMADVTSSLKGHLHGLHSCLSRLTETAEYIKDKYKDELAV